MQEPVAGNEAKAKEMRESVELVNERLSRRGRRRVETEALGRCQFFLVQQSGNLDMSVAQLRETICDYIKQMVENFENFVPEEL
eukprot:8847928-Karenia_brevis.AAC.1